MTNEQTPSGDVEALAKVIRDSAGFHAKASQRLARDLLASDWFAAHTARLLSECSELHLNSEELREFVDSKLAQQAERIAAAMYELEAEYEIEHNQGCEGEPDCPKCVLLDCIRAARAEVRG